MTEESLKIFVVDDEPTARTTLMAFLHDTPHKATEFAGGQDCLDNAHKLPDIILLDLEMPDISGVQVCQTIREIDLEHQPHIIFVSAHNDMASRMSAYNAGANDYLGKPCMEEELKQKIATAHRYIQQNESLNQNYQFAQQAAFTAMNSMGELGVVLQFLRNSFECKDLSQLVDLILSALRNYDLHGFIRLYNEFEDISDSTDKECTPLQTSILEYSTMLEQRIVTTRDYLVFNYPQINLAITNLSAIDDDTLGRLRDHLATLAEGISARIKALEKEQQFTHQAELVLSTSQEIAELLEKIDGQQHSKRIELMSIIAEYSNNLESAFFQLGLTEGQEDELLEMVHNMHRRLDELMNQNETIARHLSDANRRLSKLTL